MHTERDLFEKHLLRLGRELRILWKQRYIRVALKEPVQRGWRRFHVLATVAQRRADKVILEELLTIVGTVQHRNSPDFRKRRGRGKRRRFTEIEQPLRMMTVGEWESRRLPEEWIRYFQREKRCIHRQWHDTLVFYRPSLFELKVEPYWVTEVIIADPAVERRLHEIESWLWRHDAMGQLNRLCDVSNRWNDPERESLRNRIAQSELRMAMRDPWEVDQTAPVRRRLVSLSLVLLPT
jgi:hypothetical protein